MKERKKSMIDKVFKDITVEELNYVIQYIEYLERDYPILFKKELETKNN